MKRLLAVDKSPTCAGESTMLPGENPASPETEDDLPAVVFCDARQTDERGALICDYLRGHGGERHAERWVASWLRDGSDVRWYAGDSRRTGRPVYRVAAALSGADQ